MTALIGNSGYAIIGIPLLQIHCKRVYSETVT
jgi:hypothetical protein